MATRKEKTLEQMDEAMEDLLHNGPIQRKWQQLRQILEKEAEKESDADGPKDRKEKS